ncbi:hypothetical protein NL676_008692 [Syzygium grande]|nr:hypothetical protein NL676_008692 [Syzygium grande]
MEASPPSCSWSPPSSSIISHCWLYHPSDSARGRPHQQPSHSSIVMAARNRFSSRSELELYLQIWSRLWRQLARDLETEKTKEASHAHLDVAMVDLVTVLAILLVVMTREEWRLGGYEPRRKKRKS